MPKFLRLCFVLATYYLAGGVLSFTLYQAVDGSRELQGKRSYDLLLLPLVDHVFPTADPLLYPLPSWILVATFGGVLGLLLGVAVIYLKSLKTQKN